MTAAVDFNKNGVQTNSWTKSVNEKGEYVRKESAFRNKITADGSSGFKAESGRYHLYVSLACPWAHRTLIYRSMKGLADTISFTVVDWFLGEKGWYFTDKVEQCSLDDVNRKDTLRQIYEMADPSYTGNITVPVLFDKKTKTIVNNESSEIIRMLDTEFQEFCKTPEQASLVLRPKDKEALIDELNGWIYPTINNGVYRCGFAKTQSAYEEAYDLLFEHFDKVEAILANKRYLTGNTITEADVRLFTTLIRFDVVYVQHFKTNKKRIVDYPNLWNYTKDMYQHPDIKPTVNFYHIKHHYMGSHKSINPMGIIPKGPEVNFDEPHNRA